VSLHGSLKVYDFVASLAIIDKQLFSRDVTILQIHPTVVYFRLKGVIIYLCAQLLTPSVP